MQENSGTKWTEEEDNKLYQECVDKISLENICAEHKRKIGGIKSRKILLADKLINNGRDKQEIYAIFSTNEDEIYNFKQRQENRKNRVKNTEEFLDISDIQQIKNELNDIKTLLISVLAKLK